MATKWLQIKGGRGSSLSNSINPLPITPSEKFSANAKLVYFDIKFVVLASEGGKQKTIRFGDANLSIKKSNPARKKSYCARSGGIKGKSSKLSANYWSRKAWNC